MIRALRKTWGRATQFLRAALTWRAPDRQYALVAWALCAGLVWLGAVFVRDPTDVTHALAGLYLVALLTAVCAIDARFGIIPDSLGLALAVGALAYLAPLGLAGVGQRVLEAVLMLAAGTLFQRAYRWLRGYDGLGFGDVKFLAVAVLWIGLQAMPYLLLAAVLSAFASIAILKLEGHELHGRHAIAFGPHLAVALWLLWMTAPFDVNILGG
jgi:leader peptidase (prepilin peptidase)/N-methyltransferase